MCQPSAGTSSTWKWASMTGSGTGRQYRAARRLKSQTYAVMLAAQRSPDSGGSPDAVHDPARRDPPLLRVHGARGQARDPAVRRLALRPPELRARERRLPRAVPPALLRRARLRALRRAERELQHRGLGRRRRGPARRRGPRPRARPWHVDGRHDRARVRVQVPRPLHRRLPRRRVRAARRAPQGDLPLLAPLRRDDELGRLRRPRHDAGRRLPPPREARGREHVRDGAADHAPQLDVHRPPGLPRDGGHGPRATRAHARHGRS